MHTTSNPPPATLRLAFLSVLGLSSIIGLAQVSVSWDVSLPASAAKNFDIYRGETVAITPRFLRDGRAYSIPSNSTAYLYWSTNSFSTSPWATQAVISATDTGRVTALWTPICDQGSWQYQYFVGIQEASGLLYRARGTITMRPSPGVSPSATPLDVWDGWTNNLGYATYSALQAEIARAQAAESAAAADAAAALVIANLAPSPAIISNIVSGILSTSIVAGASTIDTVARASANAANATGATHTAQISALSSGMPTQRVAWADAAGSATDATARATASAASASAASALSALTNIVTSGGYRNASYWYLSYADVFRVSSLLYVATNYDIITSNITSASFSDKQMQTISLRGFYDVGSAAWSVTPTNIASISAAGFLTVLTAGTARVSCTVGSDTKVCVVSCNLSDPVAVTSMYAYASDSGHAVIATNIAALIAGGTATWHRAYWSTADHATSTYVRDTQCWARALDLSGVVVSSDGSTPYWHGTLVTTQHIAMAKHAYNGVGSVKRFVGASGTVYNRTITAIRDPWYPLAFPAESWNDLVFGYLSAPLPTNDVAVYSILPASYTNQFPNGFRGTYGITYDQLLRANVCSMLADQRQTAPTDATAAQFYSRPYVGDSGRPTFLLLPGQRPILLHLFTTAEDGSSFITLKSDINAALAADGAALTEANLSALKNYHP